MEQTGKTWLQHSIVSISEDAMEAHLTLWLTAGEENATVEEVITLLHSKQITYGILTEEIERVLSEKLYLEDFCVAKGVPAVQGVDGSFEFFIEVQRERHPRIREDGSVDYSDYDAVTVVEANQLLVKYHPATKGTDGMTVKGTPIRGMQGKNVPTIKGKGFHLSPDKTEYYADMGGRAEYSNGYMVVSHILEVKGNVDNTYGDIDFVGDVKIYGDVISHMKVKASGFITVEGHVEGAHLIAGKGVILKNGMQGNGFGIIESSGDVEGKFFEQTGIKTSGKLFANAILNCDIEAEESVTLEGFLGALVGGRIRAGNLVEAANIGNTANAKTEIFVGTDGTEGTLIEKLEREIQEDTLEMYKTEGKIKLLEDVDISVMPDVEKIMDVKKSLLRQKIQLDSSVRDKENQRTQLYRLMERSINACVIVHKQVYPGVHIRVNGASMSVPDVVNNVTIRKRDDNACMFANDPLYK